MNDNTNEQEFAEEVAAVMPALNLMIIAETSSFIAHVTGSHAEEVGHCTKHHSFHVVWYVETGYVVMAYDDGELRVSYNWNEKPNLMMALALGSFCEDRDIPFDLEAIEDEG